ncbi:Receptor-like serine/threonine-protein kinase ALE2 [Zea mays]|uniref:Receptor-like serine/threonine-protein kinase ALE2 n=1 Tax=Zea mays TaxID=4577 RepID=A0A3L6DS15_MAIZE|nr:Receptor-like serine/threonine-protein kinase ALE2 [Zea mays]
MGRCGGGSGAGAGGGALGGCALLTAALVISTLVIQGAGGSKQSHAPAVARKVLLSITNWHPHNYLDDVLHPSQVQDQRLERLGQDAPSFHTGNELPNPHLRQVPAALPSLPVQPYAPHPKISADNPTAAPSFQKIPWLSLTSPPLPAIGRRMQSPAASPETAVHPAKHGKDHGTPVSAPSNVSHHHAMPANNTHGKTHGTPVLAPEKRRHHHLPANNSYVKGPAVSPSKSPIIHRKGHGVPVAAPPKEHWSYLPPANRRHHKGSALPPAHPPDAPAFRKPKALAPAPSQSLLPPPTNSYCTAPCSDPLTNSPPGMTCLCVLPIKVELRFGIALYTFFTLVPELAQDIASGVFMNQSQVRVMGANAAPDDPEKTIVFIDLVPLGPKFDNATAFLVFERFCNKQVIINPMDFGKYDVLYVLYQGLPPSPPAASMNNGLSNVNDPSLHPLAADVVNHKERKGRGIIIIIILSSAFAFILCAGAALVVYFKLRNRSHLTEASPVPTKPAGPGSAMLGNRLESRPISASPSFSSSLVAYKGTAKTFNLVEMERATLGFDESRIIGEGGFGRVYEGILEDGERVAIKVLKRDDQQGTREFLAEVEMLSRLHHRNLVKLIGSDKGAARFDWDARLKIALGAARGLAYLHEDSSPRVIHRDFKSSNILLEHDFTPKVSDFGLARTALGEGNEHISTRVMGTFGYVAPEYAMTGHLLVKSDVYSYGVVLLELLTGMKPVDMLRPPGQENLVAWAGSLLTSRDGLESIVDPSLGSSIPFDSIARVAAIASMCVQPEVDQRPFMGEVVQALKLVCDEGSEFNGSTSFSQDLRIQDVEAMSRASGDVDFVDPTLSAELFTSSARYDAMDASGSFRRYSSSGPLRVGRAGLDKERGLSTGSSSEHVGLQRFRIDSE